MLTTKKISPLEIRLGVNKKFDYKLTLSSYTYLFNFYYFLYQFSFYCFRKYGLYLYPYKLFLIDNVHFFYFYFLLFRQFKKFFKKQKQVKKKYKQKKKLIRQKKKVFLKHRRFLKFSLKRFVFKKTIKIKKLLLQSLKKKKFNFSFKYLFVYLKKVDKKVFFLLIKNKQIFFNFISKNLFMHFFLCCNINYRFNFLQRYNYRKKKLSYRSKSQLLKKYHKKKYKYTKFFFSRFYRFKKISRQLKKKIFWSSKFLFYSPIRFFLRFAVLQKKLLKKKLFFFFFKQKKTSFLPFKYKKKNYFNNQVFYSLSNFKNHNKLAKNNLNLISLNKKKKIIYTNLMIFQYFNFQKIWLLKFNKTCTSKFLFQNFKKKYLYFFKKKKIHKYFKKYFILKKSNVLVYKKNIFNLFLSKHGVSAFKNNITSPRTIHANLSIKKKILFSNIKLSKLIFWNNFKFLPDKFLQILLPSKTTFNSLIFFKKKILARFNYFFFLLIKKNFILPSFFSLLPFHSVVTKNEVTRYEFLLLYKRLRFIYKFRTNYSSLRLFTFIYYSLFFKRFFLLLSFFKFILVKKKKQKRSLYRLINIYRTLFYYKRHEIRGLQFLLHGTFDRHGRTQKFLYLIGKIKVNSFAAPILFDWVDFATKYGTVSLKFWINYYQ